MVEYHARVEHDSSSTTTAKPFGRVARNQVATGRNRAQQVGEGVGLRDDDDNACMSTTVQQSRPTLG